MKYAILALLLLLSACMQTPEETLETPSDTADANPLAKEGTHVLCEEGSCRDVNGCPEGYDEFMSQIGPACVMSFDQDEISTWQMCARSSDTCSCTYVARDTKGTQLTWGTAGEGLRCAPENYRDYMVHNGLSGVDQNGEEYAMIA